MKLEEQKIDWGILPKELQATLVGIISKELFERTDEKESGHSPFLTEEERDNRLIDKMRLAILPYALRQEKIELEKPVEPQDEDTAFRARLLKDIPYFHQLYAKYRNPQSLEIAANLGKICARLKSI